MSLGSEPGRDDGGLPPVNIVIPDDARELDRDVLAYHREQRARRRRERLMRLLRPFRGRGMGGRGADGRGIGRHGIGGHSTVLPLIATCVALSMLAGAMLSVVTISPASAPTVNTPPRAPAVGKSGAAGSGQAGSGTADSGTATPAGTLPPATGGPLPAGLTVLPTGTLTLESKMVPVRTLTTAALALIPASCGCGAALRRLATQAAAARVNLYFVGEGGGIPQVPALTAQYGQGAAAAAGDTWNVLSAAYHPVGLTVLLVYNDATARVVRTLPSGFQLDSPLRTLAGPGR